MSKLKTIVVSGAILASLGLSTGALLMAYMNRPVPPPTTKLAPADLQSVAGVKPDAAKGDRVVALASALKGGNATIGWTCGKTAIGGARAEDHFGAWETIGGAVAFNAKAKQLLGLELKFATDSLTSDNNTLTNTVLQDQDWFEKAKFPEAVFTAAEFAPRTAENEKEIGAVKAPEGWDTLIRGTFTLHGISQKMAIPAKVEFMGESAKIGAACTISRSAHKVESHGLNVAGGMFTVDDAVAIRADIVAAPDVAVLVSELTKQVQVQQIALRALEEARKTEGKELTNALIKLGTALEETKTELKAELKKAQAAGPGPAAAPVDLASLPAAFEDAVVLPALEKDYMEKNPKTGEMEKKHRSYSGLKAPFKMILVPGDKAKGIAPFYIGETEVSWDMFHEWSHWYDITPTDAQVEVDAGLRPSNADSYADTSHNGKRYLGYPALGMSRKNAEAFCAMLSKQTGRTYRLPTEAEWELAHELGGGDPQDEAGKKAAAVCRETAPDDTIDDAIPQDQKNFGPAIEKIKTKKPNKLGLYDMLGNVAEWVKTPGAPDADGKNTFVRGGDFKTPAADLSGKRREESDNRRNIEGSWNANYPNDPVSKWWYKDHYQVGFRLVCEPVNLPKK